MPISNLAKDSSICTKVEEASKLSLLSSEQTLCPKVSDIAKAHGDKKLSKNEESKGTSTSTTVNNPLITDRKELPLEISDKKESLERCKTPSNRISKIDVNPSHRKDDPLCDRASGTVKNIRHTAVPQFVQRNFYVKDEFASEVPACIDQNEERPVVDMGKGKRKRFQNVRMLPIDEAVCSKVKSPSRTVQVIDQNHINKSAAAAECKDDASNDGSEKVESDLVFKCVSDENESEQSGKAKTRCIPDLPTRQDSKLAKVKQNKKKIATKVSQSKRIKESPIHVGQTRTTKKRNNNIDKKCHLSIEEELRIIKCTKTTQHVTRVQTLVQ